MGNVSRSADVQCHTKKNLGDGRAVRPAREAGARTDVPEPNSNGMRSVLPHSLTHRMLPALMHAIAVCSDGLLGTARLFGIEEKERRCT